KGVVEAHETLLDQWGDARSLPHAYAWRWTGYHYRGSGRLAELRRLLFDLDWLRAKLDATDIDALVREFDYISNDEQVERLQAILRLSSHFLALNERGRAPSSLLAGQVLARLPAREELLRASILERALAVPGAWLRPLRPSLTGGGPLVRTLAGHTTTVTA